MERGFVQLKTVLVLSKIVEEEVELKVSTHIKISVIGVQKLIKCELNCFITKESRKTTLPSEKAEEIFEKEKIVSHRQHKRSYLRSLGSEHPSFQELK